MHSPFAIRANNWNPRTLHQHVNSMRTGALSVLLTGPPQVPGPVSATGSEGLSTFDYAEQELSPLLCLVLEKQRRIHSSFCLLGFTAFWSNTSPLKQKAALAERHGRRRRCHLRDRPAIQTWWPVVEIRAKSDPSLRSPCHLVHSLISPTVTPGGRDWQHPHWKQVETEALGD